MARVYLNDVDLDVLTQYINMENYDSVRNKPSMIPAKISGKRNVYSAQILDDFTKNKTTTDGGNDTSNIYTVDAKGTTIDRNDDNVFYATLIDKNNLKNAVSGSIDLKDLRTKNATEKFNIKPEDILQSILFESKDNTSSVAKSYISVTGATTYPNFLCYKFTYNKEDDAETLTVGDLVVISLDGIATESYDTNNGFLSYLPLYVRQQLLNGESISYTSNNGSYIKPMKHSYRNPMYIVRKSVTTINPNDLLSGSGDFYILIKPVLFEVHETRKTSDGEKPLFIDSNGNKTVYEKYDNNFYKHQNALRKAFFNVCKETSWHNKIGPGELVLVEKKVNSDVKYQMQYYYNVFKRSYYSYVATTPTDAQIIYNSDIPTSVIRDLDNPDKPDTIYTDGVTHKETVPCGYIDDIPEFKAYIGSDETFVNNKDMRFTNIVGIDADNIKNHANKPVILNCYKRQVSIGGSEYELSRLGTIKIDVKLTCGGETVGGETEFEIKSPELNPYIIIPILVTKDISSENSAIYKLLNARLKVGSTEGTIKSHKGGNVTELAVTPRNLLGLYFAYSNSEIELYDSAEGFASDEIITALGGIIGENDAWFIKVPVGSVVEKHINSVICELDSAYETISIDGSMENISIYVNNQTDLGENKPTSKPDLPNTTVTKPVKPVDTTAKPGATSFGAAGLGEGILMNRDRNKIQAVSTVFNMRRITENSPTWNLIAFKPKDENFSFSTEFKPSVSERVIYHENRFSVESNKKYIKEVQKTASVINTEYSDDYVNNLLRNTRLNNTIKSEESISKQHTSPFVELNSSSLKSLGGSPLAETLFKDKFVTDDEVLKRGEPVQEDVLLTKRTNAMSAALLNILNSSNSADPLDLEEIMTRSDGREQIYNYSKAFVSLLRHDYSKVVPEFVDIENVESMNSDIDAIDKSIVMEEVTYVTPETPEEFAGTVGISSAPRPLLRRLIERDKFATEYEYFEYVRKTQNISKEVSGTTDSDRNINLKYYNKLTMGDSSGVKPDNNTREMVAGGLAKFLLNPSESFLNFRIPSSCIGSSSFNTEYYPSGEGIVVPIPSKKMYNIKYMDEDLMKSFIGDLVRIDDNTCMEVKNER